MLSSPNCLVETANWLSIGSNEKRVELSRAHQLRNVGDVHEKERLKKLRDDLVRADEQHHFPFRPIADLIHLSKDDAEEDDLAAEPKHLHQHPKDEIRLEAHLANERVAQHDGVDFEVAAHRPHTFHEFGRWKLSKRTEQCCVQFAE